MQRPEWLDQAMVDLRAKYPEDGFDVVSREIGGTHQWRLTCIDCTGKLYILGPDESLDNFEVHLKNRAHRERVAARANRMDA